MDKNKKMNVKERNHRAGLELCTMGKLWGISLCIVFYRQCMQFSTFSLNLIVLMLASQRGDALGKTRTARVPLHYSYFRVQRHYLAATAWSRSPQMITFPVCVVFLGQLDNLDQTQKASSLIIFTHPTPKGN